MTVLRYVGGHDAVDVPLPPYGQLVATVKRGETHDFPAELAARLLDQTINWQPADHTPLKDELVARLVALGVDVPSKATKPQLQALLDAAQTPTPTGDPAKEGD